MTCKHDLHTFRELTRYDDSRPANLITRQFKFCVECDKNLGEYPPRIGGIHFKGKGTNDKRRMKGDL